jgi:signal transduction histidine kinase
LTVKYSIRFRLLLMLLLTVFLLWTAVLCFTWWRTDSDISSVYDAELILVANLLAVTTAHEAEERDLDDYEADLSSAVFKFALIFQIWNHTDHLMVRGPGAPSHPLSTSRSDGFSDTRFNGNGWRVYTLNLPDQDFRIQVARAQAVKQRLVNAFVIDVMKPLLLALPLFGMLWLVVHRGLEPLRQGLQRLNHVVNQLLVLASIEPERIRQAFEQVDLAAVAEDVMSELSPMALDKEIELELQSRAPAPVFGNRELLTVMLSNLVGNAIKFTPEGGRVFVFITHLTEGISLSVEDTGPGIPEVKRAWVFERLNRVSAGAGRGLGLAIVKEICLLHQASVGLHDRKEGSGLIVNLFLPVLSKS